MSQSDSSAPPGTGMPIRHRICAELTISSAFAAIVFVAYFRRFAEFGYYGDDALFFGNAVNRTPLETWAYFWFCLTQWPQGRPLGIGLNLCLLPHYIGNWGGLPALHLAAWGFLTANMFLIYRIMLRMVAYWPAVFAGVFYGLAPAHTVRGQLTYAFGQVSIMCGLFTILAGMQRRWGWYAAGVAITVVMAETAAVAALVVPFLATLRFNKEALRRCMFVGSIWAAVVAAILVVRKQIGDPWGSERVTEIVSNVGETVQRALGSAWHGSMTHLNLTLTRTWPFEDGAEIVDLFTALVPLLVFGIFTTWVIKRTCKPFTSSLPIPVGGSARSDQGRSNTRNAFLVILLGLATMAAVYAAYFRPPWHPAKWESGFMSGVHLVPVVGASICFGGLVALLAIIRTQWLRFPLQTLFVIFPISMWTIFGVAVQRDYAAAWRFQKDFWHAFEALCPDVGDQAFVLVLDRNLPQQRYAERFTWTTEWLPHGLFDYSLAARTGIIDQPDNLIAPCVIVVGSTLAEAIVKTESGLRWKASHYFMLPKNDTQQPQNGNIAVLELREDGVWHRLTGTLGVEDGDIELLPALPINGALPYRPLAAQFELGTPGTRHLPDRNQPKLR